MLFKGKTKKTSSLRRGRKKGHKPAFRQKPAEEDIQKEIDVTILNCPNCGNHFNGCKRRYERVIEDIIVQPKTEVSRYIIHQYECQKCKNKFSAKSPDIIGGSPFGRKIFAIILFYRFRLNTPLNKIQEALKELHGLKISIGGIQGLLYQASVQFGEKYEELKQILKDGQISNADETGWRVNGENWWIWIWRSEKAIVYSCENTRGGGIARKMTQGFKGLLGRDGYAGYNKIDCDQIVCWVHMLRKAHEYCQRDKTTDEMILLKNILKTFHRRINKWHKNEHSIDARKKYHDRMKRALINVWKNKIWEADDAKTFIKAWLKKHKNRLVSFLKYPKASSENNSAERDLRPLVVLRKISGGSRSCKGAKSTCINASIIHSFAKYEGSFFKNMPVFGWSL